MTRQYDLIVFDWDGTLANSTQMIVDCMRAASAEAGLPVPAPSAASHIIGLGLAEAVHALFGELSPTQYQLLVARYRYHYYARDEETPLFEGVVASMQYLSDAGYMLAVATGKGRNGLNKSLSKTGLADFMHATRCVDECFSKPHPQMLHELMDELVTTPGRTLMIGDTSYDLQMASNAGVDSLGVTYGAHPEAELKKHRPLACFDQFSALDQWLRMHA
ncbi:MAG: HAD-IA family hydrolase [Methylophilaceae bacterium]|jgi:phosphoglycolate phosphatase|nr:HAD-IA family hydrolase [Methylophilaceae bacterium]